jgi:hypothetical protein
MTKTKSTSRLFLFAGLLAVAVSLATFATAHAPAFASARVASMDSTNASAAVQQKGRYKREGDTCIWDSNDNGPNQCEPRIKGRFRKVANDACAWDGNDLGADQCRPAKGRWKAGPDDACAWDAGDTGPDQCNPRRAK